MNIVEFAERVGVFAAATALFIWWSWQRELRMSARVAELENYVHTELVDLVKETTSAINQCTAALDHMTDVMQSMTAATNHMEKAVLNLMSQVSFRPCLLPNDHPDKIAAAKKLQEQLEKQK